MKKALIILLSVPAMIVFNYKIIALSSTAFIHDELTGVPLPDFIVIPGAGNPDDDKNIFFKSRVASAVEAFRHFPSAKIICIGRSDNSKYNEPSELKEALLLSGIPDSMIIAQASFNTFSMLVFIHENYKGKMLFVSQRLHLQRILFAAGRMNIMARGFAVNQPLPVRKQKYFRTREVIASLRMTSSLAGYKIAKLF